MDSFSSRSEWIRIWIRHPKVQTGTEGDKLCASYPDGVAYRMNCKVFSSVRSLFVLLWLFKNLNVLDGHNGAVMEDSIAFKCGFTSVS